MVSKKLIHLIEKHEDELTRRWLKDVKHHGDTPTYHRLPDEKLKERVYDVYIHLTHWIEDKMKHEQVEKVYTVLGGERFHEGFKLSEVIKALMLAHKNLHVYVREQAIFDVAAELHQLVELQDTVDHFFDTVIFYTVKGFEHEWQVDRKIHS